MKAFSSYSEIFLINVPLLGPFFFFLTMIEPQIGMFGMGGLICSLLLGKLFKTKAPFQADLTGGIYRINALLVGLSLGHLYRISVPSLGLLLLSSLLVLVMTFSWEKFLSPLALAPLSLPFSLVALLLFLAAEGNTNLIFQKYYPLESRLLPFFPFPPSWEEAVPPLIRVFCRSMGSLFFLPHFWVGASFLFLVFLSSPISFLLMFLGFGEGLLLEFLLKGNWNQVLQGSHLFNYPLVSLALGGIFLIPSPKSLLISLLGVGLTVPVTFAALHALSPWGLPVFTLPFCFAVLFILHLLKSQGSPLLVWIFKDTPENNLDTHFNRLVRFRFDSPSLKPPFESPMTIKQAFDGKWTHKGKWKYALDFVLTDGALNSYKNNGLNLEDFYTFKAPVLSPLSGVIYSCNHSFPDNPPGQISNQFNWGNYVLIRGDKGEFVLLAHLAKESLLVYSGQYVLAGQVLGACGNSGYSMEPHLHMQVQRSPVLGAETLPFHLESYVGQGEVVFHSVPREGEVLSSIRVNQALWRALNFTIGQEMVFEMEWTLTGKRETHLIKVALNKESGRMALEDSKGNQLYFFLSGDHFYFYDYLGGFHSLLPYLYLAAPRFPLMLDQRASWKDTLPLRFLYNGLERVWFSLRVLFFGSYKTLDNLYRVEEDGTKIIGQVSFRGQRMETVCQLDPAVGFFQVSAPGVKITRREVEKKYYAA